MATNWTGGRERPNPMTCQPDEDGAGAVVSKWEGCVCMPDVIAECLRVLLAFAHVRSAVCEREDSNLHGGDPTGT